MNVVYEALKGAAVAHGNRIALRQGELALTYKQLFAEAEESARQFAAQGVGPGQAAALQIRDGAAFVRVALALLALDCPVVPIAYQAPESEVEAILDDCGIAFLISDSGQEITVTPRDARGDELRRVVPDAVWLRYTSGTTGESKGVILTAESILGRIDAANLALRIGPDDRVLFVLPLAFHFIVSVLLYLKNGAEVILSPDVIGENLHAALSNSAATILYASPMHYRSLSALSDAGALPALRLAVSTSTKLAPEIAEKFLNAYGIAVSQAYGIIEFGLPLMNLEHADAHPEAVGTAAPGYEIAILNPEGEPVADGEVGELALRGPGKFAGYLEPWRAAEDVLHDGWFLTGDYARRTAEGLVTIAGRRKSVINVAGNKVFPEEVEHVLLQHEAIAEARVVGRDHKRFGEIVVAEVVFRELMPIPAEEVLLSYCRRRLSPWKVPQFISAVDHIDMTLSGKVQR